MTIKPLVLRTFAPVAALASLVGCAGNPAPAVNRLAPAGTGFQLEAFQMPDGTTKKCTVFIPFAYTPTRAWPAIVFLQGLGEGGGDGIKNTTVGLGPAIAKRPATFEYIAIFPQSSGGTWSGDVPQQMALNCLDQTESRYNVDRNRVYLTGLSTGGYGTWSMGAKYPQRWAALVPICAHDGSEFANQLTHVPIWAFHNGGDPFVWVSATNNTVDKINAAGGSAKKTIYGAIGHDAWGETYANEELWTWLDQQRRGPELASLPASRIPQRVAPAGD